MATVRSGQIRTGVTGYDVNQDRHAVDMLPKIYGYDAETTPMMRVLSARGRVKPAEAFEVKHLEDEPVPEWDTENGGGINNTDTTLTVSNGGYHRAGDIIVNPTSGEAMRVSSVSTNDLTIVRSIGTAAAASVASGQQLLNIGAGEPEGDTAPAALHTQTVTKSNYTQIVKEPIYLSRTLEQVRLYGGKQRAYLRRKAGAKHAREWEQILIWGQKLNDVSGALAGATNRPVRLAGGLNEHITTNELDVTTTGILSENALRDFVGDCSRYKVDGGGGRKALIASRAIIDTIESWGANKLQTTPGGNRYGFAVRTWHSSYGDVDVVWHPLLEVGTDGFGFLVDMAGVMIRPLQRTTLETNIQANDEDGYKDQYLTEQSYSYINEKAFGRIKGVTFGS